MSIAKWTAASSEVTLGSFGGLSASNAILVGDVDNTTNANLYISFWVELSSFTPSTGASLTVRLVRKRGSQYETTDVATFTGESFTKAIAPGAGAKFLHCGPLRIPGPHVYGVQFVNNTGATISTANNIVYQTWNEDIV